MNEHDGVSKFQALNVCCDFGTEKAIAMLDEGEKVSTNSLNSLVLYAASIQLNLTHRLVQIIRRCESYPSQEG